MAALQHLLETKRQMKARMPAFVRQDAHKHAKLGESWRKPKGIHNKMREHRKGHPACVNHGYRTPVQLRGYNRIGLKPVTVCSVHDLVKVHPKTDYALISRTVGMKKRLAIVRQAVQKGIPLQVAGVSDAQSYLAKIEAVWRARQDAKKTLQKKDKDKEPKDKKSKDEEEKVKEKKAETKNQELNKPELKTETDKHETDKEKEEHKRREKEKILTKRV